MIAVRAQKKSVRPLPYALGFLAAACLVLPVTAAEFKPRTLDFSAAPAGLYRVDAAHNYMYFQLGHVGGVSYPYHRFNDVQAEYEWDPAKPNASQLKVTINARTLDAVDRFYTMYEMQKKLLNNLEFQKITFLSKQVTFTNEKTTDGGIKGQIIGDLTMVGITKPVTVDFVYNGFLSYNGWPKMGFSGKGVFKRSAFGLMSDPTISDEIWFTLEMEFIRVQPNTDAFINQRLGGK